MGIEVHHLGQIDWERQDWEKHVMEVNLKKA